ncbi:MAG TPA: BTAD domain-containing putative transcriptional regulator [Longimicrobiaceae bacterium]|nr:BTAD domain-containing putative transcriptional regulator [Longimicrobiaceae bacterium]
MLGSLSLVREDGATSIRSVLAQPKRLSLLAYLAAAPPGFECSRDGLLGLLWPELDERHGRKALRQALYGLRDALGSGVLTGKGTELVGVDPERIWSDARAFTRAVEEGRHELALELYRGPFLDGFHLTGAPEFERWVDGERRRLERRALNAAWALVEAAEASAEPAAARRWAERAVELAPYDEEGLRRYLSLMGQSGQPAAAVHAYERYADRLRQDLELEPSADTVALLGRIRNGDVQGLGGPRTASNSGVRDAGPVREPGVGDPGPSGVPAPTPNRSAGTDSGAHSVAERRRIRRLAMFAAAIALVVLAWFAARIWERAGSDTASRRMVVLPLENRTRDASLDPVGQIAADWIVQGLAATGLVDVVPSVLALGTLAQVEQEPGGLNPLEGARVLARRLGATAFVVGSFHRRGDELEFQAQIFDADSGRLLDAIGGVRGSPHDPMAAIDELRRRTLGAVGFRFDTRIESIMTRAHRPPNYEAYLAFATGIEHRQRYEWRQSVSSFRRAFALDTTFVPALFMAALDHFNLRELARSDSLIRRLAASRERLTPVERLLLQWAQGHIEGNPDRALDAIRQLGGYSEVFRPQIAMDALLANRPAEAIEAYEGLDVVAFPELPKLTASRRLTAAYHRLGDHREELRAARLARQWHPDRREPVLWEVRALIGLGRIPLARQRLEEALAIAPRENWWPPGELLLRVSDELRAHGHAAEARALLPRVLDWYRTLPDSQAMRPTHRRHFAAALLRADSLDAAEAAFRRLADEFPDDLYYAASLAIILARRGQPAAARLIAESLVPTAPYQYGYHWYERARIAAELGDTAEAVKLLNEAIGHGYDLAFVGGSRGPAAARPPAGSPHLDPAFTSVRHHPAFRALQTAGG